MQIHAGAFNLGLVMRQLIGIGTPRGLQGRMGAVIATLFMLIDTIRRRFDPISPQRFIAAMRGSPTSPPHFVVNPSAVGTYTTG